MNNFKKQTRFLVYLNKLFFAKVDHLELKIPSDVTTHHSYATPTPHRGFPRTVEIEKPREKRAEDFSRCCQCHHRRAQRVCHGSASSSGSPPRNKGGGNFCHLIFRSKDIKYVLWLVWVDHGAWCKLPPPLSGGICGRGSHPLCPGIQNQTQNKT